MVVESVYRQGRDARAGRAGRRGTPPPPPASRPHLYLYLFTFPSFTEGRPFGPFCRTVTRPIQIL